MGSQALHVCTDPASIHTLESLIDELPAYGHVVLLMRDGSSCDGIVSTRPNAQVLRDPEQREGINATVRLRRPDAPE